MTDKGEASEIVCLRHCPLSSPWLVGWEILLLPPRACTNIMTGTNHLLGRAHGGKYSLELKLLHRVLIWDD